MVPGQRFKRPATPCDAVRRPEISLMLAYDQGEGSGYPRLELRNRLMVGGVGTPRVPADGEEILVEDLGGLEGEGVPDGVCGGRRVKGWGPR